MPVSTRFENPSPPLYVEEPSSSARTNLVESSTFEALNYLDDDIDRLENVLGITADATTVDWQSTNYIDPGMTVQEAIEALDGGGVSSNVVNQTRPTGSGTIYTSNDNLTFTVDASTDVITGNSHGLTTAQPFRIKNSGGSVPGGLSASTTYYAGTITTNTWKAYPTANDANLGTNAVNITSTGSGTHSLNGSVIFGSGTAFTTDLDNTAYIQLDSLTTKTYGVSSVDSATQVTLSSPTTQTSNSGTWKRLNNVRDVAVFTALPQLQSDATLNAQPVRLSQFDALEAKHLVSRNTLYETKVKYTNASTVTLKAGLAARNGSYTIQLASDQTLVLSTSGAGGLDTGSEANSTHYYMYLIANDDFTSISAVFSTVNEAVSGSITLPSGYTKKAQLPPSVRNDASGNILPFDILPGGLVMFREATSATPYLALTGGVDTTFTAVSLTSTIPANARGALLLLKASRVSDTQPITVRPTGASGNGWIPQLCGVTSSSISCVFIMPLNASQQFDYKTGSSGQTADFTVLGFFISEI